MFRIKEIRSKKTNNSIVKYSVLLLIILLLIYFIYPIWPKFSFQLSSILKTNQSPISFSNLNTIDALLEKTIVSNPSTEAVNKLYIPKISVNTEIVEGESLDILNKKEGVWREPWSSTPLVAGNMILAGHRFQYLPPNTHTFYNLEEISIGDDIYIKWNGITFWYKVYKTMLVNPEQIEIRNFNTGLVREITLYTCTPLYTSDKRFVVKANLIGFE